ncbi:hypothetical protein [Streptomyces sp. NPDC005281]|uniref:hypothetical protein n=1 Tax=Streptomyces sp. NPDC005281 TaxID=3155712 RepID=UPI0033AA1BEE
MVRPADRRRCRANGQAAVVAVAVLLAAACSADPAPSAAPSASARVSAARLSSALPDDPVRMVLPATGAETRWTQGLDVFVRQEARTTATKCARDHGTALPEQAPLTFIRYYELPDLAFIALHGLSESAAVPAVAAGPATSGTANTGTAVPGGNGATSGADTTAGSAGTAGTAGTAVVRRCLADGTAAASKLRDSYAALQGRWFDTLVSLRRDPAVLRALRTLPGCLAGHGIQVRDENGFFALADTQEQTVAPDRLPVVERALGSTYAECMRPVEAVREPARLRLRARFLADHATEVRSLRATLVPSLHRAAEKNGLRLAFPAP